MGCVPARRASAAQEAAWASGAARLVLPWGRNESMKRTRSASPAGVHAWRLGEEGATAVPWKTATPYDSPAPRSLAIRRTASFASDHRSRNPMLPDASIRMTRARGVGRREEANVGSAASREKRTYRSPLGSANWLKEVPAARNRMRRSPVAAGRVSLMYASAKCDPPWITGRSGWLGIWTSPGGAAVSTRACTRGYERLSRASMDKRDVDSLKPSFFVSGLSSVVIVV